MEQGGRISIHAPARGATEDIIDTMDTYTISIHAPARGATTLRLVAPVRAFISIHAPARGATKRLEQEMLLELFQSTPPRGGRQLHNRRLET